MSVREGFHHLGEAWRPNIRQLDITAPQFSARNLNTIPTITSTTVQDAGFSLYHYRLGRTLKRAGEVQMRGRVWISLVGATLLGWAIAYSASAEEFVMSNGAKP
jgi:hypothetical protein